MGGEGGSWFLPEGSSGALEPLYVVEASFSVLCAFSLTSEVHFHKMSVQAPVSSCDVTPDRVARRQRENLSGCLCDVRSEWNPGRDRTSFTFGDS